MKVKVNVQGLNLDVNIEKSGSGKTPLLMVHGIPTNARLWRHVQALLDKKKYTTYAMDMIGYGQSSMPLDKFKHTLTNQAEVIKAVIEAMKLTGKVTLVGHDHGGGASQIMASKYCGHLHRLILVNPVTFDYWPVLEVEAVAGLAGAPDSVLEQMMPQVAGNFGVLLRMGSYDKIAFTDQNIKQNYLQFWARGPKLTGFKSLTKVCSEPSNKDTLKIKYEGITCPTLICWALHDAWMPKEAASRVKELVKGPTRLHYIERAGHYVPEDRPQEVAWAIDDFLSEWRDVPA